MYESSSRSSQVYWPSVHSQQTPPRCRTKPCRRTKLRSDISAKYLLLKTGNQLTVNGTGINDITDIVRAAIPRGTSLPSAIAIFRSAGFDVFSRGAHVLYPNAVFAIISHYDSIGVGAVSVSVLIEPFADAGVVNSVEGSIILQLP